jgi:undecaprenyl-diphosphatase
MSILHAVVLGLVQGLTEFLPISSSGHLLVVPWLFGWDDFGGDASLEKAFDVALHLGTLIAVVGYFARDLGDMVTEGVRAVIHRPATPNGRLAWLIVLATIPAVVVGALFDDTIEEHLGKPWIIGVSMIGFGLLLGLADRAVMKRTLDDVRSSDALVIGAAQVLALNPGTSRSGITMTAARFRTLDRPAAARFSFLMSIPVTLGAIVFELGSLAADGLPDGMAVPMLAGIASSALSGWLAIAGLLRFLQRRGFGPFVVYRVIFGTAVLIIAATSWR